MLRFIFALFVFGFALPTVGIADQQKYVFKPYSSQFPQLFLIEKERIASYLEVACEIEHVGSTAVPGLGGKGIIDIAIGVTKETMAKAEQALEELGYNFKPNASTEDRSVFVLDLPSLSGTSHRYHLHLTYPESSDWIGFLQFRDHLRNHPDALEEYANKKREAALKAEGNGKVYRNLKDPLIKKLLSESA